MHCLLLITTLTTLSSLSLTLPNPDPQPNPVIAGFLDPALQRLKPHLPSTTAPPRPPPPTTLIFHYLPPATLNGLSLDFHYLPPATLTGAPFIPTPAPSAAATAYITSEARSSNKPPQQKAGRAIGWMIDPFKFDGRREGRKMTAVKGRVTADDGAGGNTSVEGTRTTTMSVKRPQVTI
ncbi:hypothetical protein MMC21_006126 [Puttea exsequens]|nr:hypothetical protein [Puttea exsequens]